MLSIKCHSKHESTFPVSLTKNLRVCHTDDEAALVDNRRSTENDKWKKHRSCDTSVVNKFLSIILCSSFSQRRTCTSLASWSTDARKKISMPRTVSRYPVLSMSSIIIYSFSINFNEINFCNFIHPLESQKHVLFMQWEMPITINRDHGIEVRFASAHRHKSRKTPWHSDHCMYHPERQIACRVSLREYTLVELTLIWKAVRTFIRYIASALGAHRHEHFDSLIFPAKEHMKQGQQK